MLDRAGHISQSCGFADQSRFTRVHVSRGRKPWTSGRSVSRISGQEQTSRTAVQLRCNKFGKPGDRAVTPRVGPMTAANRRVRRTASPRYRQPEHRTYVKAAGAIAVAALTTAAVV